MCSPGNRTDGHLLRRSLVGAGGTSLMRATIGIAIGAARQSAVRIQAYPGTLQP